MIYVDMDGVLCNFVKGCEDIGNPVSLLETKSKKEFFKNISKMGTTFWENLEPLERAFDLWELVSKHNPVILSAGISSAHNESVTGKINWCNNHLNPKPSKIIVLTSSKLKANYSKVGDILIDDLEKNINGWIERGGTGFLYSPERFDKLKSLIMDYEVKNECRDGHN